MLLIQTENGNPGDFPVSIYRLLIVQMEVCRLSLCLQRNKLKLSVCKRTKWTKWSCLSMDSEAPTHYMGRNLLRFF